MKGFINLIIIFILSVLVIGSISITILDLVNNRYFKELDNLKSLNNKEKYMVIDSLIIKQTFDRNQNTSDGIRFDIVGELTSNKSILTLQIGYSEYIDLSLDYQPLYKSKLTGDYFLKGAPKRYYEGQYRAQYAGIFFKIVFYFFTPLIIFYFIKYLKIRTYRII